MSVFDIDKEGQNRMAEEAKAHSIQAEQLKVSPFQAYKTEIASGVIVAVAAMFLMAWRFKWMKGILGWIFVNLFLLALILVGSGVLWLFIWITKVLGLDDDFGRFIIGIGAVAAPIASYYAGKFLHDLADGRYRRRSAPINPLRRTKP